MHIFSDKKTASDCFGLAAQVLAFFNEVASSQIHPLFMLKSKSGAKVQQKLHICKFLSGIFEKSRNSLLLLGIDSRPYACIRGGYIALKERAQPFSKIPLMLAYGLQDATVLSRWDGFSRVGALEVQPHKLQYSTYFKNPAHACVCPAGGELP